MKITKLLSDDLVLRELGERVARHRLDRHLTQQALAKRAGVGKRTVERLEAGESTQLSTLIRIFRVLDLLPKLDAVLPEPGISPLDIAKLKGKTRKRASTPKTERAAGPWEWNDNA